MVQLRGIDNGLRKSNTSSTGCPFLDKHKKSVLQPCQVSRCGNKFKGHDFNTSE